MFSIFRNSSKGLESISFGLLFFAKELALYLTKDFQYSPEELLTLFLAIVSISIFYYLLMCLPGKVWIDRLISVLICLCAGPLVFYGIRKALFYFHLWNLPLAWTLVFIYFILSFLGIFLLRKLTFAIYRKSLLLMAPISILLLLNLAYVFVEQVHINHKFITKEHLSTSQKEPIIFIIFDEWDPCLIFADGHESLFPNTYRWRRSSFYASQAYPSGTDTFPSILSMTLGKRIDSFSMENGQVIANFSNAEPVVWQSASIGLFQKMKEKGVRIGCVGGMITDYGKTFEPYVSQRSFVQAHSLGKNFIEHFLRTLSLWQPEIRQGFCPLSKRFFRFNYENNCCRIFDLIKNRQCDLIYAHLLGGHYPWIGKCDPKNKKNITQGYLSNLQVVDRFLDKLECLLKKEALWDSTTCILTSDHWWRTKMWQNEIFFNHADIGYLPPIDHRVPLFIKLKNQQVGFEYQQDTSTIFLKDLLLQMVDGSVQSVTDLQSFFDQQKEFRSSDIVKWESFNH